MTVEQRIIELERKLAYQENTIAELNEVVTHQQDRIEELSRQVSGLIDKIKNGDLVRDIEDEETPPHY